MFKKRRGIRLPYHKQGLVFFTCLGVKDMPESDREKIKAICLEVAGEEYADALYEFVTTDDKFSVDGIALRHHTSSSQLYKLRSKFYSRISSRIIITIKTEVCDN